MNAEIRDMKTFKIMFRRYYKPILVSCHRFHTSLLNIKKEVATALATGKGVVALESTIITHGMPFPQNLKTALEVEDIVRSQGCIPATIALLDGKVKVGRALYFI